MDITTLTLHTRFPVGPVDPRIFGGFLEHLGRAVYEGVYQPDSIHADEHGFRKDTLDALRGLNMSVMRYPGGNFASGYHWQDGIGPRAHRPPVPELAWQSLESNHFGTDEFMRLCRSMNWDPMLTVNLGTGTPEEARDWVDYTNGHSSTQFSRLRAANGNQEPYGVKLWCLGNEMDGPWQLGHAPAAEYALRAQKAIALMRSVDPALELVACGSCSITLPTYVEWDRIVLEYLGDSVEYLSLHRYARNPKNDTADFLAITNSIDQQIEAMDTICRYAQAKRRDAKRVYLCFDEWNVWYKNHVRDGEGKHAPHLLEEIYDLQDALVVAGFLNSFVRHADVVKIANLAQIVNVIAPILTRDDDLLIQSIYHSFAMYSSRRNGIALRAAVSGPAYDSPSYGPTRIVDHSAILDGDRLHVFLTNRSQNESAPVRVVLADRELASLRSGELLTGSHALAANTFENPNIITPRSYNDVLFEKGGASLFLPPLSVAALTFQLA